MKKFWMLISSIHFLFQGKYYFINIFIWIQNIFLLKTVNNLFSNCIDIIIVTYKQYGDFYHERSKLNRC